MKNLQWAVLALGFAAGVGLGLTSTPSVAQANSAQAETGKKPDPSLPSCCVQCGGTKACGYCVELCGASCGPC